MPLPHEPRTLLLLGIFAILFLAGLYFTAEIALPIVLAIVLNLLLQPAMRPLLRLHVPKMVAAILILCAFFAAVAALGFALSAPAADWISKAPQMLTRIEQRLYVVREVSAKFDRAAGQIQKLAAPSQPGAAQAVSVSHLSLGSMLLTSTRSLLAGLVTMVVMLFFLLVSGDIFLRRLVEILPRLKDKKQAVEISHEIEHNISVYLATISLMNVAVGIATWLVSYFCGLPDPILWGSIAFLLNYVPILGPLTGVVILFLVGLLSFDSIWRALLPAGLYLLIHFIEGENVTPRLLARRFTLNPVLVFGSIIFWYWMWGVIGALLSVPMLATFKIVCDRLTPLRAVGHFIGGEGPD